MLAKTSADRMTYDNLINFILRDRAKAMNLGGPIPWHTILFLGVNYNLGILIDQSISRPSVYSMYQWILRHNIEFVKHKSSRC